MEFWRAIEDYPDYEVSHLGRVRRVTRARNAPAGALLSTNARRNGYPSVDLCRAGIKRTLLVHRLVATAFLGQPAAGQIVNHRNGDRQNNRVENLEWTSSSGNVQHSYDIGLSDARGERNGAAKLTNEAVLAIRASSERAPTLAARLGVSRSTVRAIRARRTWAHLPAGAR